MGRPLAEPTSMPCATVSSMLFSASEKQRDDGHDDYDQYG
jgi:hypothetical protein